MPNLFTGRGDDVSAWSQFSAERNVDIANYGLVNVSSINGGAPDGGATPSTWANFPAIADINANSRNITNVSNIQLATINGQPFVSGNTPSNWATFPATADVNMSGRNLISVSNIQLATINGQTFVNGGSPSNWASFPALTSLNMSSNDISNVRNLNVSTINGLAPGGGGGGSPSNWAQFPATQLVNMNGQSVCNVNVLAANQTNVMTGSFNYLDASQLVAYGLSLQNNGMNANNFDISNVRNLTVSNINGLPYSPTAYRPTIVTQFMAGASGPLPSGFSNYSFFHFGGVMFTLGHLYKITASAAVDYGIDGALPDDRFSITVNSLGTPAFATTRRVAVDGYVDLNFDFVSGGQFHDLDISFYNTSNAGLQNARGVYWTDIYILDMTPNGL